MNNGGLTVVTVGRIRRPSFQPCIVAHRRTNGLGALGMRLTATIVLMLQGRRVQGRMVRCSPSHRGCLPTMHCRSRRTLGGQTFRRRRRGKMMQRGTRRIRSRVRVRFIGDEGHWTGRLTWARFEKRMGRHCVTIKTCRSVQGCSFSILIFPRPVACRLQPRNDTAGWREVGQTCTTYC